MRIGIATDHGGFDLKVRLAANLREAGTRFSISAPTSWRRTTITPTSLFHWPGRWRLGW